MIALAIGRLPSIIMRLKPRDMNGVGSTNLISDTSSPPAAGEDGDTVAAVGVFWWSSGMRLEQCALDVQGCRRRRLGEGKGDGFGRPESLASGDDGEGEAVERKVGMSGPTFQATEVEATAEEKGKPTGGSVPGKWPCPEEVPPDRRRAEENQEATGRLFQSFGFISLAKEGKLERPGKRGGNVQAVTACPSRKQE